MALSNTLLKLSAEASASVLLLASSLMVVLIVCSVSPVSHLLVFEEEVVCLCQAHQGIITWTMCFSNLLSNSLGASLTVDIFFFKYIYLYIYITEACFQVSGRNTDLFKYS